MALIDGLISYWSFDSNADDDHGSNDGTVTNATHETGGSYPIGGQGYDFDSFNDYIDFGYMSIFDNNSTGFSVAGWFYKTDSVYNMLFVNRAIGGGTISMNIEWDASEKMRMIIYGSFTGTNNTGQTVSLSNNTWYHMVCTWDGSTLEIYIDGSSENSNSCSGTMNNTATSDTFRIGRNTSSSSSQDFGGNACEIGVWDRGLSSSEVSDLYNGGSGLAYPFSSGTNLQLNISDAWKEVGAMQINIGDVWKSVAGAQVNIGDAWKTIF